MISESLSEKKKRKVERELFLPSEPD